jgi:tRNA(Arg) A34 adenosine deaminase TadA
MKRDKDFLKEAILQAKESAKQGGFPAGAVVVKDGEIISKGFSLGAVNNDPTGHAETDAIRKACKVLGTTNLEGCVLYSSMEPCLMCFSAANWSGITKIVYGCKRTRKMIDNGYYEGNADNIEINQLDNNRIDLVLVPDFEEEVLEIISGWEAK